MIGRSLVLLCAVAVVTSCAEYDLAGDTGARDADADTDTDADADGDEDTGPPESEDDFLALKPSQTDVYVFVANPALGTITRITVDTLDVLTTDVGSDPRVVLTTPDYDTAVVFNRGDDSISVVDADTLDRFDIGVRDDLNNMVMSRNGQWVALWHDRAAEQPDDPPPSGLQSFNEASFVDIDTAEHFPMAVGFNPRNIVFSNDSTLAVVVSDEYLALVDLTDAFPQPQLVQVADDPLDPPIAEEVALSPNGQYAFVRQFGADDLVVVDLETHLVDRLPVGINPTDLDLTPDGTRAVVVSRGSGQVFVFDTQNPFLAPDVLDLPPGVTLGSVLLSPAGDQAVLYSTASLEPLYATWNLDTDEITLRGLVKPIAAMAVTPTGGSLLVFHTLEDAVDADPGSPFNGEWAVSLIDFEDFRANPILLPAEPIGYANAGSGERGYLVLDGVPLLAVLDYRTLLFDEYTLRSDPVFIGVLPDLDLFDGDEPAAWVSQEHPLGRISFFDPDETSLETITGFELNSQIED